MLSFILPAHNEEALLGQTLQTLRASASTLNVPFEIIVVDDDSTDNTAAIAISLADRVVSVKLRQIAAVRNAGAREARGDVLVFVDADTLVPPGPLHAVMKELARGAVGGGAWVEIDTKAPLLARLFTQVVCACYGGLAGLAGGCFLFARRSAFEAVGGFDERYFASEEAHLSRALQKKGRFRVVRSPVITSGRKLHAVTFWRLFGLGLRVARGGMKVLQQREGLGLWYEKGLREQPR
jgi:glycosyltransferase involved in cell wall biosynthesis